MKAVIFAAGKSTRTYPLTLTRPKPLLTIANKTILEHQLDALESHVDTVALVVGYRKEMIQERFGDRYKSIALEYVEQTEQRGTGHALLQCIDLIDAPFMALNGDDLYTTEDLGRIAAAEQGALAKHVDDPSMYGVFEVGPRNTAKRIVEKPKEFISNLANIGAYKFTPDIFSVLKSTEPSERGEIEITSAIQTLIERGAFEIVEAQGHWFPIGYPWHLIDANEFLLNQEGYVEPTILGTVHPTADLSGPISVGKGTVIKAGVVIQGPVIIGDNCTIGPNCFIRPATAIGNGCKVGQGDEIKNSIIMDGAQVPHLSYIGDSVVGVKANIACGTVTANFRHDGKNHQSEVKGQLVDTGRRKFGAIFGDEVHTGINTSIYPGRKLWPGISTLPGQVVDRDITG